MDVNIKELEEELNKIPLEQLKTRVDSDAGYYTNDNRSSVKGLYENINGKKTYYTQSVAGSALKLAGKEEATPSQRCLDKADTILNEIRKGSSDYQKEEAILCLGFIVLYRKMLKSGRIKEAD